jgi:site-specific DNA-cytosine methylase
MDLLGNLETRGVYHSARDLSWDKNFPHIPLLRDPNEAFRFWGAEEIDLAIGHPPCGSHSLLGNSSAYSYGRFSNAAEREAWHGRRRADQGLLPLFVNQVNALRPLSFALDNLPKILKTSAPPEWWQKNLPKYHLTYITMRNWDYGTPQLRERLWVVGIRKPGKKFLFKAPRSRLDGPTTALSALRGLDWEPWKNSPAIGHVHVAPDNRLTGDYRTTIKGLDVTCAAQLALGFLSIAPERAWPYRTTRGTLAVKIGRMRIRYDNRSKVLTGLPSVHHPYTGWPLTPRERARLMDWPDDFILGDAGTDYDRRTLMRLTLYTGKAVPSAFPRYLIPQIIRHLRRQ